MKHQLTRTENLPSCQSWKHTPPDLFVVLVLLLLPSHPRSLLLSSLSVDTELMEGQVSILPNIAPESSEDSELEVWEDPVRHRRFREDTISVDFELNKTCQRGNCIERRQQL